MLFTTLFSAFVYILPTGRQEAQEDVVVVEDEEERQEAQEAMKDFFVVQAEEKEKKKVQEEVCGAELRAQAAESLVLEVQIKLQAAQKTIKDLEALHKAYVKNAEKKIGDLEAYVNKLSFRISDEEFDYKKILALNLDVMRNRDQEYAATVALLEKAEDQSLKFQSELLETRVHVSQLEVSMMVSEKIRAELEASVKAEKRMRAEEVAILRRNLAAAVEDGKLLQGDVQSACDQFNALSYQHHDLQLSEEQDFEDLLTTKKALSKALAEAARLKQLNRELEDRDFPKRTICPMKKMQYRFGRYSSRSSNRPVADQLPAVEKPRWR